MNYGQNQSKILSPTTIRRPAEMGMIRFIAMFFLLGIFILFDADIAQAQTATLPSITVGRASLVTPAAAVTYYTSVDGLVSNPRTTNPDPDIVALATALRHDPDVIYRWVHDNIELDLTFGLGKGARGAAIDKAGTPFDQAHLMVELLRASGYTASYSFGTITLTGAQFTDWTGISDAAAAQNILGDGAVPATIVSSGSTITSVTLLHCWVLATIGGTVYAFDPSFKSHSVTTGINVSTASGFNGATFLASALSGSTSDTTTGAARMHTGNVANVASTLQTNSQTLLNYIRTNLPNGDIDDVIGGRHIVASSLTPLRQATLPYQTTVYATFSNDMPNSLRTKLTVTADSFVYATYFDVFYGDLLSINWNDPTWFLYADKTVLASGHQTITPTGYVSFALDHPYAANGGAYMDRTMIAPNTAIQSTMFVYGLGTMGPDLATRFALREGDGTDMFVTICKSPGPGEPPSCGNIAAPAGDANMVKAQSAWFAQYARMADIYAKMSGGFHQMHDVMGFSTITYNQADGATAFTSSLKFNFETGLSFESLSNSASGRAAALAGLISVSNTLEGNTAEQTSGSLDPVSVASKFDWLNRVTLPVNTNWIYYANSSNWLTVVKPKLLADHNASALVSAQAEAYINAGYEIAIPISSDLGPGADLFRQSGPPPPIFNVSGLERGGAIIAYKPDLSQIAYVIVRNTTTDKGGGGSSPVDADPSKMFSPDTNFTAQESKARQKFYSVDLQTGALAYSPPPDIVAGHGDFPESLGFQRVFRGTNNGWTNNQMSGLQVSGSGLSAMGGAGSQASAETLVAVLAQLYLAPASQTTDLAKLQNHITAALVNMWWAERLAVNNATVTIDNTEKSFTRLADNTYFAPGESSVLSGTVARTFGASTTAAAPGVGGWYGLPVSQAPVQSALGVGLRGPTPGCPSPAPGRFTLTEKDGVVVNFDYRCQSVKYSDSDLPNITTTLQAEYRITSRVYPSGLSVTYTYDQYNRPTSAQNSLGRKLAYFPDFTAGYNDIQDQSNPAALRTAVIKGGFCDNGFIELQLGSSTCIGQIDQVADPLSLVSKYVYVPSTGTTSTEDNGALGSVYAAPPLQLQNEFLPSDPINPKSTFAYDGDMRVTSITDALSNVWPFHIANGRRGESVDPLGNPATTLYDDRLRAVTMIDALGNVSRSTYDGNGRVKTKTNPEGDFQSFTYDVRSNILTTTNTPKPASLLTPITTFLTYSEGATVFACVHPITCNRPLTWKNGNGAITNYAWDPTTGLLTQVLLPADPSGHRPETDFGYTLFASAFHLLTSKTQKITTTQNVVANYAYNASNFYVPQSVAIDPAGLNLVTAFTFDPAGNVTSVDGPRTDVSDISNFTWDADRRPMFAIAPDPDGAGPLLMPTTKFSYTPDGYLSEADQGTVTSISGGGFINLESVAYSYDAADQRIKAVAPTTVTQYSFDTAGRAQCTATRMNSAVFGSLPASACTLSTAGSFGPDLISESVYDGDGHVLQEIRAFGTSLQETYATHSFTPNGKEASVFDALGATHTTAYTYDGFDRLSMTTFPDATTEKILTYDNDDNVLTRQNRAAQTLTYTFDAIDRMATKFSPSPAVTTSWTYLLNGAVSTLGDTAGNTIAYGYDTALRRTSETQTIPGLSGAKAVSYMLDAAGNRTRLTWPDGYLVNYTYDAMNRMMTAADTTQTLATYTYDPLSQRTALSYGSGTSGMSYAYAPGGDLLTLTDNLTGTTNDVTFTNTFNNAHQLVTETTSNSAYLWQATTASSLTYTANTLNEYSALNGTTALAYDANGNFRGSAAAPSLAYDAENRLLSMTTPVATYAYDPLGRRVQKTVSGAAISFIHDSDNEIAEYDTTGTLSRRFVPGPALDDYIAMVTSSMVRTFFRPITMAA